MSALPTEPHRSSDTITGLQITRSIGAPAQAAWELLTDTTAWPQWGATVSAVDSDERFIHLGAEGRVRSPGGLWLPFVVDQWEDGRYWSWRVFGVRATTHAVRPTGEASCDVTLTVPLWAPAYLAVCWDALRRIERLATP